MSMQDRLGAYQPLQLLSLASGLSLTTLVVSKHYAYNFPLLLFGLVAHEITSSSELLRQFLNLLFWSAFFDIIALITSSDSLLTTIIALVVLVLKAPIGVTCSNLLRERGGEFRMGGFLPQGGQNWSMPSMPSMPGNLGRNNAQSQPSVPGAFPSSAPAHVQQSAPSQFPSSGGFRLGGEEDDGQSGPPGAPAPGRNGYSSIA